MVRTTLNSSYTTVSSKNRSIMLINDTNSNRLISINSRFSNLVSNSSFLSLKKMKLLLKTLNHWKIWLNNSKILANNKQIWVFQSFLQRMMGFLDKTLLEVEMKVFWTKLSMGSMVRIPICLSSSSIHYWASKPIKMFITELLLAINKAKIKCLRLDKMLAWIRVFKVALPNSTTSLFLRKEQEEKETAPLTSGDS